MPGKARGSPWIGVLALGLAGALAHDARADLWGYIDPQGTPHFATTQVDDRYTLFFKGATTLDPAAPGTAQPTAPDAAFAASPLYRRVIAHPNVARLGPLIERVAKARDLEPALVKAMVAVESAFEPLAESTKGALGLMQVIPDTAARYGVVDDRRRSARQKLFDPAINLDVGTRYLRDLLALFAQDLELALAAYNAGEQAVKSYRNTIPPFAETREYVRLVLQFRELYAPVPPPVVPTAPRRPRLLLPRPSSR